MSQLSHSSHCLTRLTSETSETESKNSVMKYSLRKGSLKDQCPACGKRSFTPYVDSDGVVLSPTVGRCDREYKCRYHLAPAQYLREHGLTVCERSDSVRVRHHRVWKTPSFIDPTDFRPSLQATSANSLFIFLHRVFDTDLGSAVVDDVLSRMAVGTSLKFGGSPIFWLIDSDGRIRDGKIVGYDTETGKRIKHPRPLFTNVHTLLKTKYDGEFRPCFFGEHLVSLRSRDLPVWLFESEKAALVTALSMESGGMWLGIPIASGGCATFNPTDENKRDPWGRLRVLRGRRVVLFPDEGKFEDWSIKGRALRGYAREVYISTAMERERHPVSIECDIDPGDGFDDLLLRYRRASLDTSPLLLTSYGYRRSHRLV